MANKQLVTVESEEGSATILLSNVVSVQRNKSTVLVYEKDSALMMEGKFSDEAEAIRIETELVDAWKAYWGIL